MAFYNWGEQVSNSFMNMLAMNQQKKLEEKRNQFETKRLGMEQQRVDMAGQELASNLETNKASLASMLLQNKHTQLQMDEFARTKDWRDKMGNRTLDPTPAQDDPQNDIVMPTDIWLANRGAGYETYNVPVWDESAKTMTMKPQYGLYGDQQNLLSQAQTMASSQQSSSQFAQNLNMDQQRIDLQRDSNNINSGLLGRQIDQANRQELADAEKFISGTYGLAGMYRAWGDGTLKPFDGAAGKIETFRKSLRDAFPNVSSNSLDQLIWNNLNGKAVVAKDADTKASDRALASIAGNKTSGNKKVDKNTGYALTSTGNSVYIEMENNPSVVNNISWDTKGRAMAKNPVTKQWLLVYKDGKPIYKGKK